MAQRKHRDYENKGLPSVTTIISQLSNYGLMEWFKRTPYDEIIRASRRGKQIGTDLHSAIENFINTGNAQVDTSYPDEILIALKSFVLFKKENPDVPLKISEKSLQSIKYQYNGTVDCLSDEMVVDWKSSTCGEKDKPAIYDEAKIQVSAYCYLINEIEGTNFKKALIVSIAKDKIAYNTYKMDELEIRGYFNEIFLPLLGIYNFKKKIKEFQK